MDVGDFRNGRVYKTQEHEWSKSVWHIDFGFTVIDLTFGDSILPETIQLLLEFWANATSMIDKLDSDFTDLGASFYLLFKALANRAGIEPSVINVIDQMRKGENHD